MVSYSYEQLLMCFPHINFSWAGCPGAGPAEFFYLTYFFYPSERLSPSDISELVDTPRPSCNRTDCEATSYVGLPMLLICTKL